MQKRKVEELKIQAKILGAEIDERTEDEKVDQEREAMERQADPLKGFPDDIEYFDEKRCRARMRVSNQFGDRIARDKRWDEYRMAGCLGEHGPVARRCSMNDVLWGRFLQQGEKLSLDHVKRMIMFDMKRRELYPADYKGTGEEPPPVEYLAKLREQGRLDGIHRELDELSVM